LSIPLEPYEVRVIIGDQFPRYFLTGIATVLFVSLGIPVGRRLISGTIPADTPEGSPLAIRRDESPRAYWRTMCLHLLVLALFAAIALIAWFGNIPHAPD
jgi:hypothetical protein